MSARERAKETKRQRQRERDIKEADRTDSRKEIVERNSGKHGREDEEKREKGVLARVRSSARHTSDSASALVENKCNGIDRDPERNSRTCSALL